MLNPGTRIGSYQVLSAIGAGGMGEVYRARDTSLNRDVAIKILPDAFAADPDRMARFTREAQTLASLNHPNIATIYGTLERSSASDGHAGIVMELLDGATLRDELTAGSPPVRRATDWAIQMANGLAAAHEKAIVHRDLKPENIFVTRDGRIKILDFGIARTASGSSDAATRTTIVGGAGTEPGAVLGTVGYMSPEQVRAQPVDERSDIFSLGAVLYETFGGRRPFSGDSAVETLNAILTADPPSLDEPGRGIPPAIERIVRRCLEKRPADRFHSAHDVALALEATSVTTGRVTPAVAERPKKTRWALAAAMSIALLAGAGLSWALLPRSAPPPTFQRLTFGRGSIEAARFVPGTSDVVFAARWEGGPLAIFNAHPQRREAQPLGFANASLFAVSRSQELALMLAPRLASGTLMGTLARAPMGGGGARELSTRTPAADFIDGSELLYSEYTGERTRIFYPAGHEIFSVNSRIQFLRCAPRGDSIALINFPAGTQPPALTVIDRSGAVRGNLTVHDASGLAWSADGRDVLFSTADARGESTVFALRPGGKPRVMWRGPGAAALQDVRADGTLLVNFTDTARGVLLEQADKPGARELGWLDDSTANDISPSGDALLLTGRSTFSNSSHYIRKIDGSPAVRIGDGWGLAWSSDGRNVISLPDTAKFVLTPVGAGTPRELPHPGIEALFAWTLPDGRVIFNGRASGTTAWRFFVMDSSGRTQPIGPDALDHWIGQHVPSDDGRLLAAFPSGQNQIGKAVIVPLDGGAPMSVAGVDPVEAIIRFTPDGQHVLVYDRDRLPVRIFSLDYRTGQRMLWREFMPADPTGIAGVQFIAMTPGGSVVAYNYERRLSTLYLVQGVR